MVELLSSSMLRFLIRQMINFLIFLEIHDVVAIERWCTMAIEATFRLNKGIESLFNVELTTSITLLENTLKVAFSDSKTFDVGYFIGHDEHLQLVKIVKGACQLSFDLQHGFVTCKLYATTIPA